MDSTWSASSLPSCWDGEAGMGMLLSLYPSLSLPPCHTLGWIEPRRQRLKGGIETQG